MPQALDPAHPAEVIGRGELERAQQRFDATLQLGIHVAKLAPTYDRLTRVGVSVGVGVGVGDFGIERPTNIAEGNARFG